jgi:hypothetical protein
MCSKTPLPCAAKKVALLVREAWPASWRLRGKFTFIRPDKQWVSIAFQSTASANDGLPTMKTISSSILGIVLLTCRIVTAFNPLEHSGPASPYFDAPPEDGISEITPDGCVVDQAAYIVRHGS